MKKIAIWLVLFTFFTNGASASVYQLTSDPTHVKIESTGTLVPVSDPTYLNWLSVGNLPDPICCPGLPGQSGLQLTSKLAAGIVITSTGTPALNAIYALDPITTDQVRAVANDAAASLGLPGGGGTFVYPDITGTPHTFTSVSIQNLYKAMRDMVWQMTTQAGIMAQGGTPTWPTQSATIP